MRFFGELWVFLTKRKMYFLIPIGLFFLALGVLIFMARSSPHAQFIYFRPS